MPTQRNEKTTNQQSAQIPLSARFQGIGWNVRLQQKHATYYITLAKEIIIGNALKKGDDLFYYLLDCDGRKALLVFLDGKQRPAPHGLQIKSNAFLIHH